MDIQADTQTNSLIAECPARPWHNKYLYVTWSLDFMYYFRAMLQQPL